ncbi:TPA: hypothetical protein ACG5Y0_004686, partial [Escherichia coli]
MFQGATSLYTAEEVYSRFKEHEFRATNDFKKCRLMVTGKIKKIGTVTFSKNPLVTGFAPIFPDTCYHLTHYWPAAADIPVASDNP